MNASVANASIQDTTKTLAQAAAIMDIRGAAGPEKPSAFVSTRNQAVDYFVAQYHEVFSRHRMRRGARIGFAPNSLLIPCSAN